MTRRVFIQGMVQGVGMRPFLALLAKEFGIAGTVKNIGSNVEIIASSDEKTLDAFIEAIIKRKPEMAEIVDISSKDITSDTISVGAGAGHGLRPAGRNLRLLLAHATGLLAHATGRRTCPPLKIPELSRTGDNDFKIIPSTPGDVSMLPADFPVCADCVRELQDKKNRRFRHPFISCAVCGPRYSIMESAPYDRCNTSMVDFPMCPECAREYGDPANRRYHAQTISCHDCGPYLIYSDRLGNCTREEALEKAISSLKSGGIVAVKGVGGYHLACSPHDEQAVLRLRALKGREKKPFAIMFKDVAGIERFCVVSAQERELLNSPARPIVLLATKGSPFAPSVSGDALLTGAFLPYTPLQILLLQECPELVMTSANETGRPEIYEDAEMLSMLAHEELSGVLYNARRIVTRLDDSVARINAGARQITRRSRGLAPRPITSKIDVNEITEALEDGGRVQSPNNGRVQSPAPTLTAKNIVAYGSDLKSAFCLIRGSEAYMSQYFGDMEELEVQRAYVKNLSHMQGLFSFVPALAACDLHPGYHSSRLAHESGLPIVEVQHHHAHIASVMAEHGISRPVIGLAFDGTGYGTDGAVWGGEFLVCTGGGVTRRAHLAYVKLVGGDSVAVDARKAALCYCEAAGIEREDFDGAVLLRSALANNVNTMLYSGMGRLFDAVSSLLGICHVNGYEGQCAIALENAAHHAISTGIAPLNMDFEMIENNDTIDISVLPIIRIIALAGHSVDCQASGALGFHDAVCRMALGVCQRIRDKEGINTVALSGGTFQNELILSGCMKRLLQAGFEVYTNNEVPCNDGGLALGQAYVAALKENTED